MSIEQISLIITRPSGRHDLVPATIERKDGRILKSPFILKDEIKAMKGGAVARLRGGEPDQGMVGGRTESSPDTTPPLSTACDPCVRRGTQVCLSEVRDRVRDGFQRLDRANALFYEAKRACQRCQRGFHRLYARERKERKGMINNMPIYIKVTIPL